MEGHLNVHHRSSAYEDYETYTSSRSEISSDECEDNNGIPDLVTLLSVVGQANMSRELTEQPLACDAVNKHQSYHSPVSVSEQKVILTKQFEGICVRPGYMKTYQRMKYLAAEMPWTSSDVFVFKAFRSKHVISSMEMACADDWTRKVYYLNNLCTADLLLLQRSRFMALLLRTRNLKDRHQKRNSSMSNQSCRRKSEGNRRRNALDNRRFRSTQYYHSCWRTQVDRWPHRCYESVRTL